MPKRLAFHIPETRYEQELDISSLALQGIDSDFFLDEKPFLAKLAKKQCETKIEDELRFRFRDSRHPLGSLLLLSKTNFRNKNPLFSASQVRVWIDLSIFNNPDQNFDRSRDIFDRQGEREGPFKGRSPSSRSWKRLKHHWVRKWHSVSPKFSQNIHRALGARRKGLCS